MSLANLQSPFGTPGLPAGSLPTTTPPGSIGFDPTKVAQQMQVDPNVRTMMAQFFGDPASRQFVQDSGGVVPALARPDNPWTPGTPIVASSAAPVASSSAPAGGASFGSAAGPSGETGVTPGNPQAPNIAQFFGQPPTSGVPAAPAPTPGASLASRASDGTQPPATAAPGTPQPYGSAQDYFKANPGEEPVMPARPVAPMDNVHGARKALFLAFLGLNKFGAGLDHQQNSYADEFLGRQMQQTQAQAAYDNSQPQMKQQAEDARFNQILGTTEKQAEITQSGAQAKLLGAQAGQLGLNPPGKNEFLTQYQQRLKSGTDDPASVTQEFMARAAMNHTTPEELAAIASITHAEAPQFKIGEQGIAQPLRYGGQLWSVNQNAAPDPKTKAYAPGTNLVNEPNAPPEVQQAAMEAKTVQDRVQANKVQSQAASKSNIAFSSGLAEQRQDLETGQKNANDAKTAIDKATNQQQLIGNLAVQAKNNPEAQQALMMQILGVERPEDMARVLPTAVSEMQHGGGLSDRIALQLQNWKQGDTLAPEVMNGAVAASQTIAAAKIKAGNDALDNNFQIHHYQLPGTGPRGRFDEVQTPAATTTAAPTTTAANAQAVPTRRNKTTGEVQQQVNGQWVTVPELAQKSSEKRHGSQSLRTPNGTPRFQ